MLRRLSYSSVLGITILILSFASSALSAAFYLNHDSVLVATPVEDEFELELWVDADVHALKLFVAEFAYDPAILDTVAITEGTLWDGVGLGTNFGYYIQDNDSTLRVEGLVLGGGAAADGPGLLATIRLKGIAPGSINFGFKYYALKDVDGNLIEADTSGTVIRIDSPPSPFNLLQPNDGSTVSGLPGESFDLVWASAYSEYPGETIVYDLDYSTSQFFDPSETFHQYDLVDSFFTLHVNDLPQAQVTLYWRVVARGDIYGFEKTSNPIQRSFIFQFGAVPPAPFDLSYPGDLSIIDLTTTGDLMFDWEDAVSIIPDDEILYRVYIGPVNSFPGMEEYVDSTVDVSELMISHDSIPVGRDMYWKVVAENTFNQQTWSNQANLDVFFYRGDANGNGKVNISDLTYLISYLFGIPSGPAPYPSIAGDSNCTGSVNVSDVTFIVTHLFGIPAGPAPYCP